MSRRSIDPQVVAQVAGRFGVDPVGLSFVRDVANVVYRSAGGDRFLRFTHRDDRSEIHVRAEIEWLAFLVSEGLPVCRPLPAGDGQPVVSVNGEYAAVAFARVRGRELAEEEYLDPMLELVGRFLGQLHDTSARFEPRDPGCARPHWYELDGFEPTLASWDPGDRVVIDAWRELFPRLEDTEVRDGRYGLIHGDVHRGNVFLHEGHLEVYDFDDSCRFFLAADVANSLYYSLWFHRGDPEPVRTRLARGFLAALLRGYRAERPFDEAQVALIPDLLELRDLTVDAFSHRRRPNPDAELQERYRRVRERLTRGAPYVEL